MIPHALAQTEHTVLISPALLRGIAARNEVEPTVLDGYEYAVIRKPHTNRAIVYYAPTTEAVAA